MSIFAWPTTVNAEDQIELVPVAIFATTFYATFPCGDANRDSEPECYGTDWWTGGSMLIVEHERGTRNQYREIATNTPVGQILDVGYADADSAFDLLANPGNDHAVVYEALGPTEFPSESVWATDWGHHVWRGYFLNYGGSREIFLAGDWIRLYKCTGDNQYVPTSFPYVDCFGGDCAFGDFDRDGLPDVATGTRAGDVMVFERIAENQYVLTCSLAHDSWEAEGECCAAANDMDRDSLKELIALVVSGDTLGHFLCDVKIYEAARPGQYELVWCTVLQASSWSLYSVVAGDVDGDGIDEFCVNTGSSLRLFKCTGKHEYAQVWQRDIPMGVNNGIRMFDINGDGRDELIVAPDSTYIFEDTAGLGVAVFERLPKPQIVTTPATIVRKGSSAPFRNLGRNTDVVIYDIRGRMTAEHKSTATEAWRWDLTDRRGRRVPAGTYLAVIRSGTQSARVKLCVVN